MEDNLMSTNVRLDFETCKPPHASKPFIVKDLTCSQQMQLNRLKTQRMRKNNLYLRNHPEVRALVQIILQRIFLKKPSRNIYNCIAEYFLQSKIDIEEDVRKIIEQHAEKTTEPDVIISRVPSFASFYDELEIQRELKTMGSKVIFEPSPLEDCKALLDEIMDRVENAMVQIDPPFEPCYTIRIIKVDDPNNDKSSEKKETDSVTSLYFDN